MRLVKCVGITLFSIILLAGCEKSETSETATTKNTASSTTATFESSKEIEATFENGILNSQNYNLDFKKAQIVKSPTESGYGLYIVFDITNNSNEDTIVPYDVIEETIVMEQTTDTSVFELANNYFTDDVFGDDVETQNQQMEKEKFTYNELLPGKTVEAIEAYSLEDIEHPVEMTVFFNDTKIGSMTIEIDKLESPETPETNENEETSESEVTTTEEVGKLDNDTIAQRDYWEAVEYGLSEEEIAYYLSHKWYGDPSAYDGVSYRDLNDYLSRREESPDTSDSEEESTIKYQQAIDEGATPYQAEMYATGVAENWIDVPVEKSDSNIDYGTYDSDGFAFPQGTSSEAAQLYKDIVNKSSERPLTGEELQILYDIENGTYK